MMAAPKPTPIPTLAQVLAAGNDAEGHAINNLGGLSTNGGPIVTQGGSVTTQGGGIDTGGGAVSLGDADGNGGDLNTGPGGSVSADILRPSYAEAIEVESQLQVDGSASSNGEPPNTPELPADATLADVIAALKAIGSVTQAA